MWLRRAASQRGLVGQVGEVGADHAGRGGGEPVELDVVGQRQRARVDLEDLAPAVLVGRGHRDPAVEAAGPQQRGVEHLGPVGRAEHDHGLVGLEAVHLREDLVERLLTLVVPPPKFAPAVRDRPIASSSSMKTIPGADSFACLKRSRTREAPTPTIASTNSDAEIEKNGTPASPATARASRVLPVPGRPESRTPFGMRPPSAW